jgi:iron-sulfur cluster assembly protein
VTVVVDPFSAPYLQGSTIDFLETIQESGFKVENPNVVAACGCGHSFQVAEGEELPEGTQVGGCGSGCAH